jgi:gluconolactonase
MGKRCILTARGIGLIAIAWAFAGSLGGAAPAWAQTAVGTAPAGPVQPWGLPPVPPEVGPVEKFADVSKTPQGQFLEGGAFDTQGREF